MGVSKEIGFGIVHDICPNTGYPRDVALNLLNTVDDGNGSVMEDWSVPGTVLPHFTNPYGLLNFAIGSGDDFHCFDFQVINAGPRGMFIILDCTLNSETGGFIERAEYCVAPCNTHKQKVTAIRHAQAMIDRAEEWCENNGVKHDRPGWNQTPGYFLRSICAEFWSWEWGSVSERSMRMGSKTAGKLLSKRLDGES